MMELDWSSIIPGILGFVLGLILKGLLDLNFAMVSVKYLSWLPVRSIFRSTPKEVSGSWEQKWDFTTDGRYINETDRHSHTEIKQLWKYIYAEFYSENDKYYIFGEIKDNYIIGHWGDLKDKEGYFGSFQLRVINSSLMTGRWIGHSKSTQDIFGDNWHWKKMK